MDDIESRLKEYILKKYKSLSVFCKKIDMPWTTLDSILKRGICKSSYLNILKIAEGLEIETDCLVKGEIVPKDSKTNNALPSEDIDFLVDYHLLDEYGKAAVRETLQREKKRCAEMNTLQLHKLLKP